MSVVHANCVSVTLCRRNGFRYRDRITEPLARIPDAKFRTVTHTGRLVADWTGKSIVVGNVFRNVPDRFNVTVVATEPRSHIFVVGNGVGSHFRLRNDHTGVEKRVNDHSCFGLPSVG
jgi:hypothetical protein